MRPFPDYPTLDFLRSATGFVDLVSRLSGMTASALEGEGLLAGLRAVDALGIGLPGDAHARSPRGYAFAADFRFVMHMAGAFAESDRPYVQRGSVPPDASDILAALGGERAPFGEATSSDGETLGRYAARWFPAGGAGPVSVMVAARSDGLSVSVIERDGGDLRMETRDLPYEDLPRSLTSGPTAGRLVPFSQTVFARSDKWKAFLGLDLRGATWGALADAWDRRGAADWSPTSGGAFSSFKGPKLRPLSDTRIAASWRIDVFAEDSVEREAAGRGFLLSVADFDPAMRATRHVDEAWGREVGKTWRTRARIAECPNPERVEQAFASVPVLAELRSRWDPYPRRGSEGHDPGILARLSDGESPRGIASDILDSLSPRRRWGNVARRTFMGMRSSGEGHGADRTLHFVDCAFGSTHRRGGLTPLECLNVTEAIDAVSRCLGLRHLTSRPFAHVDRYAAIAMSLRDASGRFRELPEDVVDALRWFRTTAERAGLGQEEAIDAAVRAYFPKGRRVAGLREANAEWHRRHPALDAAEEAARFEIVAAKTKGMDLRDLFPALDLPRAAGEMAVERIDSTERCIREGREMDHCVAGHRARAAAGDVVLLSIVDREGRSTACLSVQDEGLGPLLRLEQVKGPRNAAAPASHRDYALLVVADVNAGLTEAADHPFFAAVAASRRCAAALAAAESDVDEASAAALSDASFEALRPFLPRDERSTARVDWVAARASASAARRADYDAARNEDEGRVYGNVRIALPVP